MTGRRAARTPRLPLFEAGPPVAPPLPPAAPEAPPSPRRFLMLHGAGLACPQAAIWALRFSPLVGIWREEGLLIETTGLPEPEPALLARILTAFEKAGHPACGLLGAAPAALAALLRAGLPSQVLAAEPDLARLPVSALALPGPMIAALHRLGLREVAALEAQPRGPLARRFGPAIALELAALRGAITPFTPIRPPPSHVAARDFLSPLVTAPGLERAMGGLIATLCEGLLAAGEGARILRLTAFRADGSWQELRQGFGRASREPAHLLRLMARRVEELRPELGFERLILAAEVEPLTPRQPGLPGEDTAPEELATLLDRLGQRVQLWRLTPHASHWPERAIRRVSAFAAPIAFTSPVSAPSLRPLRLLRRPLPLEAVALLPDAPPSLLRLGRQAHRITRAMGPERLEPEWWQGHTARPRDYYAVQTESGARWWVCRSGAPGGPDNRWYLHGYMS